MRIIALSITTASAFSISSATAQSLPDNMYLDGYIEVSSTDLGGGRKTLGRANLNFGLEPNRGAGLGVGFSIGIDAIKYGNTGISEAVVYPSITFALGNTGLLSVGVPRPVMDYGYIPQDTLAHSSSHDAFLDIYGTTGSFAASLYLYGSLTIGDRPNMYGLRYDGEFGNTKIGAAYHRMSISGAPNDINVYSVAFQHRLGAIGRLGDTKLFGAVERLEDSGFNFTIYTFGAEANSDKLRTGLILSRQNGIFDTTTANLYADYKFTDRFSLAGSILHIDSSGGGSTFDLYGLGVEYQFLNGGYLNANYSSSDIGSSNDTFEVSLGWRF
ncbi:hypothetical protein [Profundibacter sp.]